MKPVRGDIASLVFTSPLYSDLRELIARHTFVGCVTSRYVLLQHSTKLYLADTVRLSEAFFYQLVLFEFANFGYLKLSVRFHS